MARRLRDFVTGQCLAHGPKGYVECNGRIPDHRSYFVDLMEGRCAELGLKGVLDFRRLAIMLKVGLRC